MANEQAIPDLNAVLENPELMEKIRALAKGLTASEGQMSEKASEEKPDEAVALSALTAQQGAAFPGFSKQDIALLKAIGPYLGHEKQEKLNQVLKFLNMAQLAQGMKDIL